MFASKTCTVESLSKETVSITSLTALWNSVTLPSTWRDNTPCLTTVNQFFFFFPLPVNASAKHIEKETFRSLSFKVNAVTHKHTWLSGGEVLRVAENPRTYRGNANHHYTECSAGGKKFNTDQNVLRHENLCQLCVLWDKQIQDTG